MIDRARARSTHLGLTLAETLVAMAIFTVVTGAALFSFRHLLTQSPQRILFEATSKQLDVVMEKIAGDLEQSNLTGVNCDQLDPQSSILSVQRAVQVDNLGKVTWEEALHVYWKPSGGSTLKHIKLNKDQVLKYGVALAGNYATRPDSDQLQAITRDYESTSQNLTLHVTTFKVHDEWKTDDKALEIEAKAVNPQMQEQNYSVQRAIWLGR